MLTTEELVQAAFKYASELEQDMSWQGPSPGYAGYWDVTETAEPAVSARAVAALDFLERYGGHDTPWAIRGHKIFDERGLGNGARALADILRSWAAAVTSGILVPRRVEAQGARAVASIDLMEQVRVLAEDRNVHPAAPIVLAGAALEVALRSAVDELQLTLTERPSITAYARRLRTEGMLSQQDVKDVEQMAGLRNSAAHGQFNDLSSERAGLMEQQVNFFLARLSKIIDPSI